MPVWGAGPVAKLFVARKLKAHFPFPGPMGCSCPVRLVHHRDDATSTSNRLVSGSRFHFEWLMGGRSVVLGDVARGGFLGEVVKHVLRQARRQILRHVATVVGGWHRACSVVLIRAGELQRRAYRTGRSNYRSFSQRGDPSGVSAEEQGPTASS